MLHRIKCRSFFSRRRGWVSPVSVQSWLYGSDGSGMESCKRAQRGPIAKCEWHDVRCESVYGTSRDVGVGSLMIGRSEHSLRY